jgi:hypothetical protein
LAELILATHPLELISIQTYAPLQILRVGLKNDTPYKASRNLEDNLSKKIKNEADHYVTLLPNFF